MPIVADAAAAVRADLNPFIKDLKGADKHVESLGARMKAALSPKALVGGLAAGFAVGSVVNFLTDATQAAGEFQDTVSATGVLFDAEYTPALEKWADTAHSAFGASKQDALAAANSMAVFGKAAGLQGQALVDFSTDLTQLGGDLASFFGGRTEDAITAVGSALRGEFEPIRRYGVLLDDATLRQKAFEMGLISSVKEGLTPQIKTLAAQAAIMEQTADAQGDFGRTSDGLMNTQRDLAASFENLQIELGEKLLPMFTALARFALQVLIPVLDKVVTVAGAAGEALEWLSPWNKVIEAMIPNVKEVDKSMDEWLGDRSVWAAASDDLEEVSGNADAAASHYMAMGETMADASEEVEVGARSMASAVETEWEKAHKAAVEDARALPGDLSQALLQGQADVESGMEALTQIMEDTLSDAEEMARLRGIRTAIELSGGLTDERASVRAAARQLYEDTREQLDLLASGAADAAVDAGTTFAEQIRLQSSKTGAAAAFVARTAAGALRAEAEFQRAGSVDMAAYAAGLRAGGANAARAAQQALQLVRNQFAGSEPKDPQSPLRGITTAFGFWHVFTEGLNASRPDLGAVLRRALQNPMTQWASWATPLLTATSPVTGGLPTKSLPASIENHWHLTVGGVPFDFTTRDGFIKALDDLAGFRGDGRVGPNG